MDRDRFFKWETIEIKGSQTGVKKTTCPVCSHTRKKKKDPCLYVNFDSGVAKCYNCHRLSFRDSEPVKTERTYELPSQDWQNYTKLHDKIVEFCESRRITQKTLIEFGVTQEPVYMPQRQSKVNSLVFNYFENQTIVNKKYRDLKKNFTQSKGGKPIFYNINSIIGCEKVYIVEGEFDVLAMYEAGYKNVISLPSGANDNDDYWLNSKPYLKDVKHFVLAVDNDEKGKAIREKIAHRLGKHKCTYIEWSGKDANDDLITLDIFNSLKSEKRFPVTGTFNFEDLQSSVMEFYRNGLPNTLAPKKRAFGNLSKVFSTMQGQMTVVTGIPSHGKSNFLEWYVLNLIHEYDVKCSFFSPEHNPMGLHMTNFMQKAIGKPFFGTVDGVERMNEEDISRFGRWSKDRLYFTAGGAGERVDWDWIISKFEEQIFNFGINIFVVDAWNKVQLPPGQSGKEGIDTVLTRLTAFCQQNNVQLFLVAHPTKMRKNDVGKYELPQLYDVSGSADFRNQTHNGFAIYRNFPDGEDPAGSTDFYNQKTKMSFQGEINEAVKFRYHLPTARYYVEGCKPYHLDLTEDGTKQPIDFEEPKENINLNEYQNESFDFENKEDECPF